jgi:hypothetical protein
MNIKYALPFFLLVSTVSLGVAAEDEIPELVVTGQKLPPPAGGSTVNTSPTQNQPASKAGGQNSGPDMAASKAAEAAAATAGKEAEAKEKKRKREKETV